MFIDLDPNWYTQRAKEAIHIRLHPNNINRDSGSKFPKHGYLQSNNATADQSGPMREHLLTTGIIMRIEMHQ